MGVQQINIKTKQPLHAYKNKNTFLLSDNQHSSHLRSYTAVYVTIHLCYLLLI